MPETGPLDTPMQVTAPHTLSFGEAGLVPGNAGEPAWAAWRAELAALKGNTSA